MATRNNRKPLWKVADVAEYFNISRSAIYALMNSGALGSVKIGKARRIPEEEVDRIIRESITARP